MCMKLCAWKGCFPLLGSTCPCANNCCQYFLLTAKATYTQFTQYIQFVNIYRLYVYECRLLPKMILKLSHIWQSTSKKHTQKSLFDDERPNVITCSDVKAASRGTEDMPFSFTSGNILKRASSMAYMLEMAPPAGHGGYCSAHLIVTIAHHQCAASIGWDTWPGSPEWQFD